jgi:hypothetical protein
MDTDKTDDDRVDEAALGDDDAENPRLTPEVAPPDPPEGGDCTDPGPGRDPRPDLRGA